MEQLFLQLCVLLNSGYGFNEDMCNKSFLALYTNSSFKQEFDASQKYEEKQFFSVVDRDWVGAAGGVIWARNSFVSKEIHFKAPIRPIAETLEINWTVYSQSYYINWSWQF